MCGFAGFLERDSDDAMPARDALLKAMGRQLAHRGPDDEQRYLDNDLSLVFRRLAIVDLPGGRQPIWNEDQTVFVVVNGEIYNHQRLRSSLRENHRFRTASDSEIVLHLYEERGPAAFTLLVGMFSVALWDTRARRLLLARDPLGIKPLYYASRPSTFVFGSELKALLVHPKCPADLALSDLGRPGGRLTSYIHGIEQVPGGQYLECDSSGTIRRHSYWSLSTFIDAEPDHRTDEEIIANYAELLEESVTNCLMSDVPVGVFLSGGIDSAIVASIAAAHEPIHAFNILEPNVLRTGDARAARDLAHRLDLPFHQVRFDYQTLAAELDWTLDVFEYFIWLLDAPRFDLEWVFKHELHRYAKKAVPDLKVIIVGQGADEFAGGYSNPADRGNRDWSSYLDRSVWNQLRLEFVDREGAPRDVVPYLSAPHFLRGRSPYHAEMLRRCTTLQQHNLWHEDRTSSGQGIEARVPFLDHRIVEFLARIPVDRHERLFYDKAIVRHAGRRWLRPEEAARPKVRFFMGSDVSPIRAIQREFLSRSFDDFRERYLESPDSLLSLPNILALRRMTLGHGPTADRAIGTLLECMALDVFAGLCRSIVAQRVVPRLTGNSPLCEVEDLDEDLWSDQGASSDLHPLVVLPDDSLELSPDVRFYLPLTADRSVGDAVCVVKGDLLFGFTPEHEWVVPLFRLLEAAQGGMEAGKLAALVGVTLDELTPVIAFLYGEGCVHRSARAPQTVSGD